VLSLVVHSLAHLVSLQLQCSLFLEGIWLIQEVLPFILPLFHRGVPKRLYILLPKQLVSKFNGQLRKRAGNDDALSKIIVSLYIFNYFKYIYARYEL
jgi:uncharacterized membrane protein